MDLWEDELPSAYVVPSEAEPEKALFPIVGESGVKGKSPRPR